MKRQRRRFTSGLTNRALLRRRWKTSSPRSSRAGPPRGSSRSRPLRLEDDRAELRSGNIDFDRFFQRYPGKDTPAKIPRQRYRGQNQFRHHIGTSYVAVEGEHVVGFATVAPSEIVVERIPSSRRRRLPNYPMPVLRLARLAVDERARGRGIGRALLKAVFVLAKKMSRDYGCVGVVVDAKPEAVAFYERYGFMEFPSLAGQLGDRPQPQPTFLELGAIPEIMYQESDWL